MFEQAILELEHSGDIVGKIKSFQDYAVAQNAGNVMTAPYISINTLSDLSPELRNSNCMVFRLGAHAGDRKTHFSLVKTNQGWSDFFFIDNDLFGNTDLEVYLPSSSVRSLFAYHYRVVMEQS